MDDTNQPIWGLAGMAGPSEPCSPIRTDECCTGCSMDVTVVCQDSISRAVWALASRRKPLTAVSRLVG